MELKETQCFVISFDEALNNKFHKEEMDFFVKYFNKDRIVCRYLTSRFLGDTSAKDLKKEFEEGIQELDMKNRVQVSMDGPNVNWKLYNSIVEERNQNDEYLALIDIGSCIFMLCMEHSGVVCRRQNGEMIVYSRPCTTCLISPQQKEITEILLDLRFFHSFLCMQVE